MIQRFSRIKRHADRGRAFLLKARTTSPGQTSDGLVTAMLLDGEKLTRRSLV